MSRTKWMRRSIDSAASARSTMRASPRRLRIRKRRCGGEPCEARLRRRLGGEGQGPDEVAAAVDGRRSEGAMDDAGVAAEIAHTETTVRRRGKLRVRRQIEQAGIAPATARSAPSFPYA